MEGLDTGCLSIIENELGEEALLERCGVGGPQEWRVPEAYSHISGWVPVLDLATRKQSKLVISHIEGGYRCTRL